jgi:hypothetical protein
MMFFFCAHNPFLRATARSTLVSQLAVRGAALERSTTAAHPSSHRPVRFFEDEYV